MDKEKFLNKSFTILLCTANVQNFETNSDCSLILNTLDELRQDTDDIVFLGLQETSSKYLQKLKRILPKYEMYDHRNTAPSFLGSYLDLSNTFFVYNKAQLKIEFSGMDLPQYADTPPRYTTLISMPDINLKVANTHFLGGRYDDPKWHIYPNARNEQAKAILAASPTIVMGDFNADNTPDANLGKYWEGILRKGLNPGFSPEERRKTEQILRDYRHGVHAEFEEQDYLSLLNRQELKQMGGTGFWKDVVDWIYVTKKLQYRVVNWGMIKAIDQKLSDHNFPWVRIEIHIS